MNCCIVLLVKRFRHIETVLTESKERAFQAVGGLEAENPCAVYIVYVPEVEILPVLGR